MKAKNISYPYPVLGNEDDAVGSFDVSFKHVLRRDTVVLKAAFTLKNKTLEQLIKERKAFFTVEIECPGTFFRKSFYTFEKEAQFILSSSLVREHVSVGFYIRAAQPILKYRMEDCHSDYKGFSFEIGPGDVLALGGFTSFIAEKDFDPMRPAVSSLIAVKQGTNDDGPMLVSYNEDKIIIKLSKADHQNYALIKNRTGIAGVLHASIVLPVLADAIRLVKDNDDELQGTYWFRRLEIILRQLEMLDDEPLSAAQRILKDPIQRCLSGLVDEEEE